MLRANLNDILVFVAAVEGGSISAGGEATGLTRSAAGKAITRIESRLGVRLLHRTTRILNLTEEGRTFHEHSLRILETVAQAEASVAGSKGTPRGLLRLTAPQTYGRRIVLPLIQRYLDEWPGIQVEASFADREADIIEEGFDLAIRIGRAISDKQLVSRVIARHRTVMVASPAYLAAHGTPSAIDDLAQHDGLLFSSRGRRQAWSHRQADRTWVKAPVRSRLRLDSGSAIRDAANAGYGIALLPDFLIADDLEAGRLVQVLPEFNSGGIEILAIYPSKRLLEPRVRRFIDLVVSELDRFGSDTGRADHSSA